MAGRAGARKPAGGAAWRGRVRGLLHFAVAAGAGFAIAYLAVYLFVFPSRVVPDDRPVPDVRGRLRDDAERDLRAAGFAVRVGATRVNASVPPGTVVSQAPAPAVPRPRGATVTLDVSGAP